SFPTAYAKGIPLGTQSTWGWHAFPNTSHFKRSETYRNALYAGRNVSYALQGHQNARKDSATEYFRQNPHRVHLGHVGFRIFSKAGKLLGLKDLQGISQQLNPYTGEILSHFEVEGVPVDVITFSSQNADDVHVRVKSSLLATGQLRFYLDFPFPSQQFLDEGVRYQSAGHRSQMRRLHSNQFAFKHVLDQLQYSTYIRANVGLKAARVSPHQYEILMNSTNEIELQVGFGQNTPNSFSEAREINRKAYVRYWNSGGMIDFGNVKDPRAKELERRMILSMYLTKIQSTGAEPHQETGLTYNSWYGRPHLEMTWWHVMHFGYWRKTDLLAKYAIGTKHKGTVRNLTNFGLFLELEEGIDGLVHVSDLSWTKKIKHPSEFVKVGDSLDVVVIELDADNRRLALGHKQLEENPWDTFESVFTLGSTHKATIISKNEKFGVLELPYGIEGLAPLKQLTKADESAAEAGEALDFVVTEFHKEERKIILSHTRTFTAATAEEVAADAAAAKPEKKKATKSADKPATTTAEKSTMGDIGALSALKEQMEGAEREQAIKKLEKKSKKAE
ncbi:MAG: hypothetical protein RJA42_1164, partial [Bacteroidota bacterium]